MAGDRWLGISLLVAFAGCGDPAPQYESGRSAAELGREVYVRHCLGCHQADGSGVPGLYPPLAKTEWVLGDKDRLIRVLLQGLSGKIEVNGEIYNQEMASSGFLEDEEIAGVLTYIRTSFGNRGDGISSSEVASVRARIGQNEQ